jgi:hypothetical protein
MQRHLETQRDMRGTVPRGPPGQKRPADVIARSMMVARIATGKIKQLLPRVSG